MPDATASPFAAGSFAARAAELARAHDTNDAAGRLLSDVDGDRAALEAAHDEVAAHLHSHVDDWEATATLTVLNQSLSRLPRVDPLDWRVRWAKHRKP